MAIAHFPVTVLDCPDAEALAAFYARLLDGTIEVEEDGDWATVTAEDGQRLQFQRVDGYVAPRWPGQDVPQQLHLDLDVDDLDTAEAAVLAVGATKTEHQPGTTFRVFLDPVGHPFCLCVGWLPGQ